MMYKGILLFSLLGICMGAFEWGVDRPYGDLPNQPTQMPEGSNAASCEALCKQRKDCLAFVFSAPSAGCLPGYLCWLKAKSMPVTSNRCLASGIKGRIYKPLSFTPFPAGTIRPSGWLLNQLKIQATGLAGYLSEFWPNVANSTWIGGNSQDPGGLPERVPYWLNGVVPTAYLTGDVHLIAQVEKYLNYIMDHQTKEGWLGPNDTDAWSRMPLLMALIQYAELKPSATSRVVDVLWKFFKAQRANLFVKPLESWAQVRYQDLLLSIYWMLDNHPRNQQEFLYNFAQLVTQQGADWKGFFRSDNFPKVPCRGSCPGLMTHGVNVGQALKSAAVEYRMSQSEDDLSSTYQRIKVLDQYHGMANGIHSCSEHLAGLNPSQGAETCTVVETMFSYEWIFAQTGDVTHADRIEMLAFNALPASMTADLWAHVYLQQVNGINSKHNDPNVYTTDGPDSNIYGLEPNYGCCTVNFAQGWPKFTSHLFMATGDKGLIAVTYAPAVLKTAINGVPVTVTSETNYPWENTINMTVNSGTRFPFYFRIPTWTKGATVVINGKSYDAPSGTLFAKYIEASSKLTTVVLTFPMGFRVERRLNDAISVYRGPLLYALSLGEKFQETRKYAFKSSDFVVSPTSPWQYALSISSDLEKSFQFKYKGSVGNVPFSPMGSPVTVLANGKQIQWNEDRNSAAVPPQSPVTSNSPLQQVTMLPFGATHVRMAELPFLKN